MGFTSLGGYYKVLYGETLGKSRIPQRLDTLKIAMNLAMNFFLVCYQTCLYLEVSPTWNDKE